MNLAVIVNPVSAPRAADRVRDGLLLRGLHASWFETTVDDPGGGMTRAALDDGAETIIACGGDGTVRAVAEVLAGTDATLVIASAGTGNLLARNLDGEFQHADAVDVALHGRRMRMDLGSVNGERFAVMAGAGLDASMIVDTPRESKDRFGSAAYVATLLRHLRDRPLHVRLEDDDGDRLECVAHSVVVANVASLQGGVQLAAEVDPTDGALDVLILPRLGVAAIARLGRDLVLRRTVESVLVHRRASSCSVRLDRPSVWQLDGEARRETTRLHFAVEPATLVVAVPHRTHT